MKLRVQCQTGRHAIDGNSLCELERANNLQGYDRLAVGISAIVPAIDFSQRASNSSSDIAPGAQDISICLPPAGRLSSRSPQRPRTAVVIRSNPGCDPTMEAVSHPESCIARYLRRYNVSFQVFQDGHDSGNQPLVPHLINLALEILNIVVRKVGEPALFQQVVTHRQTFEFAIDE